MSAGAEPDPIELQERIYRLLVDFEGRLDAMETRHEENCRILAWRISQLVERELARRLPRAKGD